MLQIQDDKFVDYRWKEGRWDLDLFKNQESQQMDWKAWDSVCPTQLGLLAPTAAAEDTRMDKSCCCMQQHMLPCQQHWSRIYIKAWSSAP